ncbi:MAG: hypothetical protein IJ317_05750 [Clostridia bacterium]|nr:hypothetical protein [Clostridia bacterium]
MSKTKKKRGVIYAFKKWWLGLSFPLFCKVHGVKNADRQGAIAQSRQDDKLQIVHRAVDGFKYNVYVYSVPLNRVMGFLDEYLSKKLVKLFGKDFCRDARIENVTGGGAYKYYGCNIRIVESMTYMEDCEDFSALRGE